MAEHEIIVQTRLGPERQRYYFFPKGEAVWFEGPHESGTLTKQLQARKLGEQKIEGLQAWEAEETIHLYRDKRYWQRSTGTHFGAYAKNARKRET